MIGRLVYAAFPIVLLATAAPRQFMENARLNPEIHRYVLQRLGEFDEIPTDRRAGLNRLAGFIQERVTNGRPALLMFICTHNSRRSQLGQVWAAVAAAHFGLSGVQTFSGGTEVTACNPRTVEALRRAGFVIDATTEGDNPIYHARFGDSVHTLTLFSKRFSDAPNAAKDFAALMTCSDADQACPAVPGAAVRIALPYEDPKSADGSPEEIQRYDECCRQIAREMLYVFSRIPPIASTQK